MDKVFTALILGLSAEGLLICPFFAFGLSLSNRLAGFQFLLGRLVGLVMFGLAVSILGRWLRVDVRMINLLFGIFIMALGLYMASMAKEMHGKRKKLEGNIGFGLGLVRGLFNPGRKYIYLIPLLFGVGIAQGIAVSTTYALSSSVYLILGFMSAGLVEKLIPYRKNIRVAGGIMLTILGGIYIWKARGLIL